jgi:hypothetical protein
MGTGRRLVCCHYLVSVRSQTIFLDAARYTSIKVTACFGLHMMRLRALIPLKTTSLHESSSRPPCIPLCMSRASGNDGRTFTSLLGQTVASMIMQSHGTGRARLSPTKSIDRG